MSLRQRFMLTFFGLTFVGVVGIGGYSIVTVHSHLLSLSRDNLDRQARYVASLLAGSKVQTEYLDIINEYATYSGHRVDLLNADFKVELTAGTIADSVGPIFSGIAQLVREPTRQRRYIRLTATESNIREAVRDIRYIIYGGILGALLISMVLSLIVIDKITDPIRNLARAARSVAAGKLVPMPESDLKDEIGALHKDVGAMAARLQEDIKDLKQLNRAQEDFIAALSHEMHNPIFSARGYLEMAMDEAARLDHSDELTKLLEKSNRNLLRIRNLYTDMITLVRLEFDREDRALVPVPLNELFRELAETFEPQAQAAGLELKVIGHDLKVLGRPELLKIVLSNLLSNAIRHTKHGTIRLEASSTDGQLVTFEVRDEGTGIALEQQTLIFDKFYRVDKGRSREHGGTGLGLALVSQCMRALGSEIKVDSQVGKGSRFWFTLQALTD